MGSRANYVLIEDGQAQLFYSHWGGLSTPAVMLTGPESTARYIRELEPDDSFLAWFWADGGILLDRDHLRARFWGGDAINVKPFLRRPLLADLAERWPGWQVEWSQHGQADLQDAYYTYHPRERPLEEKLDSHSPATLTPQELPASLLPDGEGEPASIVTIRWPDGDVGDFIFYRPTLEQILPFGPQLVGLLSRSIARPLLREGKQPLIEPHLAFLDAATQIVWVGVPSVFAPSELTKVQRFFPGWSVHGHTLGLAHHAALSGRDPHRYQISDAQARKLLNEALAKWKDFDPAPLMAGIRALQQNIGGELRFASGFSRSDRPAVPTRHPRKKRRE